MAKTAAERQREYRQRRELEGSGVRLDLVVSHNAAHALNVLAKECGTTKRDVVESLLLAAADVRAKKAGGA